MAQNTEQWKQDKKYVHESSVKFERKTPGGSFNWFFV